MTIELIEQLSAGIVVGFVVLALLYSALKLTEIADQWIYQRLTRK